MLLEQYWNAVLNEVLNKKKQGTKFQYINFEEFDVAEEKPQYVRKKYSTGDESSRKRYYVGEPFPSVYFTQREFDCIAALVRGSTIKEIAVVLELSPRTVEFYLKNAKEKLSCNTRSELLAKIINCELIQTVVSNCT